MNKYDGIIDLPHHVSADRRRMSLNDRAAQFAPFAALTGHDAAIAETARLTDSRIELSADRQAELSRILDFARAKRCTVQITHFVADALKSGGRYVVAAGVIKSVDEADACIVLENGSVIALSDVYDIKLLDD